MGALALLWRIAGLKGVLVVALLLMLFGQGVIGVVQWIVAPAANTVVAEELC